jgi:hypothetical protein
MLFQIVTIATLEGLAHFWGFLESQNGLVRKSDFREDPLSTMYKWLFFKINYFLTFLFGILHFRETLSPFTKMEERVRQPGLLPPETLPPPVQYESLFQNLPSLTLRENKRGRPPLPQDAFLKAFIYKALRRLKTLTDLAFEFHNNPTVCQVVGFNPYVRPPSVERFSQFIRNTPHSALQEVRSQLVQTLLEEGVVTGKHLAMDSCPILADVRENNLKTAQ